MFDKEVRMAYQNNSEIPLALFAESQQLGICIQSGQASRSWVKTAFLFVQYFVSPALDHPLGKNMLLLLSFSKYLVKQYA